MSLKSPRQSGSISTPLTDAVNDSYVDWRGESAAVATAYEAWNSAPSGQRTITFAAYIAALDREELAAHEYQRLLERVTAS